MSPRPLLLLALFPWLDLAEAAVVHNGNPPGLHEGLNRPAVELQGRIQGFKVVGRHGRTSKVSLSRTVGLDEPLQLPAGDWTELVLELEGPLTLRVAGSGAVQLWVEHLSVLLEEPGGGPVRLDWTLPDGAISALQAGLVPTGLVGLLEDGALAVEVGP